jgi:hypothetical protein
MDMNITLVTPPETYFGGKPKILLWGDDDMNWKNEIVAYANANFETLACTFYYDQDGKNYEWVVQHSSLVDEIFIYITDKFLYNNSIEHLILGNLLTKQNIWVASTINSINIYGKLIEHLNKKIIDDNPIRLFSKLINNNYLKR